MSTTRKSFWGGYIGMALSSIGRHVEKVFVGPINDDVPLTEDVMEVKEVERVERKVSDNITEINEVTKTVRNHELVNDSLLNRLWTATALMAFGLWAYVGFATFWFKAYGPNIMFQWPIVFKASILTPNVMVVAGVLCGVSLLAIMYWAYSKTRPNMRKDLKTSFEQ